MKNIFIFNRKNIVIGVVLTLTLLTFLLCFISLFQIEPTAKSGFIKVVLDAGHGGIDGGVSGIKTKVKESDLNLAVTKKVEEFLVSSGIDVVLTRNSDAGLYGTATKNLKRKDMEKRKEIILKEKPNLVISIHMNYYSVSSRFGAQVFYKNGDENSKLLADNIQQSFNSMESAKRSVSALTGDYYILNCSEYPSVIAECGFLSNPEEEALLIDENYQKDIAYAIFKGVIGYLSVSSFEFF